MKAILTSTKLKDVEGSVELVERLISKSRSEISVAIINEASAIEFGNHRVLIDTMTDLADSFGGSIEIIHLLAISPKQIIERINAADMLFVLGGNTDWLKIIFDKTGVSEALPKILENKLYVGSSAGSMILGHRPSDKIQDQAYGEHEAFSVGDYLDLLDFLILPHWFKDSKDRTKNLAMQKSKLVDYPVYAISDNAAVVVDGEKIYCIGFNYMKLVKGKTD